MSKKLLSIISIMLLLSILLSLWQFPSATPALGIVLLLFSLAITVSSIFKKKHKQTEKTRPKIVKDVLTLVLTLGGLAGMFANHYASPRFGTAASFASAVAASFAVGYFVKTGAGRYLGKLLTL